MDAEDLIRAATGGRPARAREHLDARPELAEDPWVGLVLGRPWEGDVNRPGGPLGWPPLVYVAHSALADAAALEDLLRRGADPNAAGPGEYGPVSALYGASGVVRDPARTRALLAAGATPDDNDSLYHATEVADTTCLRLLLDANATTAGTHALAHALDHEPLEPVRLLLDAGADPNEGAFSFVAHAVRRGRGPEAIELLAAHGADLDRPGGETWRGNVPLRTPYQHAVLRARDEVADVLRRLGADTAVADEDRAVAALARGEAPAGALPTTLDVDQQEVAILAALAGHVDVVADALGPDFAGVVGGSPHGTLLHHAAWVAAAEAVRALLGRGADPLAQFDTGTPLDWAVHGSRHHAAPGRDPVAAAEALVAAGDTITVARADAAEGPLRDWLAARAGG